MGDKNNTIANVSGPWPCCACQCGRRQTPNPYWASGRRASSFPPPRVVNDVLETVGSHVRDDLPIDCDSCLSNNPDRSKWGLVVTVEVLIVARRVRWWSGSPDGMRRATEATGVLRTKSCIYSSSTTYTELHLSYTRKRSSHEEREGKIGCNDERERTPADERPSVHPHRQ